MDAPLPSIGVIGTGVMGRPIAGHLAAAGARLTVHARSADARATLAASGFAVAASPAEVAGVADVILLALPDAEAVESVVLDGIVVAGRLRPGTIVVDLSTIDPADAVRIGERIREGGGRPLDAPMSGGEAGATAGTLSLMVGGESGDLEAVRPVLATFARTIVHVGPLGSGQVAKAVNQLVVMGTLEVVGEAFTLAEAVGLDQAALLEVLTGGLASSRVLELAGSRMIADDFVPGGKLEFHAKDITTVRRLAADAGLSLPAFEAAARAVTERIAAGDGGLDHAALVRNIRDTRVTGPASITYATPDRVRAYELPGRAWSLLLGPQNSPSRRMTMSLATFPPGSAPGMHVHAAEDEVVHVLSGTGRLEAEAGGGPLGPGASFHVPAGLWHGAVNDGSEPLALLCVFSPPVTPAAYDPPITGGASSKRA